MVGSQAFECGKIGASDGSSRKRSLMGCLAFRITWDIHRYLEVTVWISLELGIRGLVVLAWAMTSISYSMLEN